MRKIAVIGSGLIGRAWAISFARAGFAVSLYDAKEGAAASTLADATTLILELEAFGLLDNQSTEDVASRISVAESLTAALADAVHIQENAPEVLDVKRELFATLDELASPDAIIASSTSALLPSKFTDHLKGRHRCLVVHPINPPYLIPAVEIVPAPWTDAASMERTRDLLIEAGHKPIVMKREIDGFVMNRLQGAVLEEAFRLVADGYASIEDVDIGLREGLALRWSFMGPFETIDLNAPGGVRDYVQRYEDIYIRIHPSHMRRASWNGPVIEEIERERNQLLPRGDLAKRHLWRDRRLMALAAHKKKASREIGD